jgi:hypothetical protein
MADSNRDSDKARENWMHYVHARDNGHLDYVKKAKECRRFFLGQHWDDAQRAILEASGRPVLTINKIFSTMMTVMGEQISTQADISFQPTATGNRETADALSKVWLQIARNNKYPRVEEAVFDSGAVTSRGFFDVRMDFDDHMRGEARIKHANGINTIIDPDADEYDPATWSEVFTTKWMNLNQIELMWGKDVAAQLKSRDRSVFEYGYDSIDAESMTFGNDPDLVQYNFRGSVAFTDDNLRRRYRMIERQFKELRVMPHFVDVNTGDTRVIPNTWERNRIAFIADQYGLAVIPKKVEVIRWRQSLDDILLFDEVSPYRRFTKIPYFPVFYDGQTIGLVENLLSPQEQLNKISSQELHVVNTTANSGWKVKSGALQNMDIYELENRGAETGLVVELDDIGNLDKIAPNQVPTGLDRLTFKADENIKDLSGISDSLRGFDRADVAAKAIRAKQQAGSVNLTKAFRNLLHTRHMVAEAVLDLVQTFYTEERVIKVNGNGLLAEAEELTVNGLSPEGDIINDLQMGEYEVVVTDVPKRETFEETQFDEATRLRELGVNIPDDILVEASHLANKADVAQRIRELNGAAEPTEIQQQLQQLEIEKMSLDNELAKADVMKRKAETSLALVQAQGEALDQGKQNEAEQTALEAEKSRQELVLKREEAAANIELKRNELQASLALQREQAREKIRLERALAEVKLETMRQQAEANVEATELKTEAAVEAAKQKAAAKPAADTSE